MMKNIKLSTYAAIISASLLTQSTFAAAFQLYEQGTPIIGTAAVGQAANTNDASTAYFNPAGMGFLPRTEFMLGSQMILPFSNFYRNNLNTISGDNGGNAGSLTPGMSVYYSYAYSPALHFGLSVTSPYGGSVTYNDGWVGRYVVQNAIFYTVNVNPSISYRFNPQFAVGAGVAIEYMHLQQATALPNPLTPLIDGQINLKTNNYAPGFNLGLMFAPYPSTKIGVAYRSQITHHLNGDVTFLRISSTPAARTKMVMPQNIIASWSQDLSNRFTLLTELGWSNWSKMRNTILTVDNFTAVTPRNWNDTYRVGIAGKVKATYNTLLQAGVSYDSSPTNASNRLPDLPMDRQIRAGAGVIYTMRPGVDLGLSYEYWNLGSAKINNTSSNGVLAGSYGRNFANTFQVSVNVQV